MGFFGTYVFTPSAWGEADPDAGVPPTTAEPWLYIDIHDSDIATIRYAPSGQGRGEAFLGTTPRAYFDDPNASAPTDVPREAEALSAWERTATGRLVEPSAVEAFLASDDDVFGDAETDDAEIFVEVKAARFLASLGLPVPPDLQGVDSR